MKIQLKHRPDLPTQGELNKISNLVILLPERASTAPWPAFPFKEIIKNRLKQNDYKLNSKTTMCADLPNETGTRLSLSSVGPDLSTFELLRLARRHADIHLAQNPRHVTIIMPGVRQRALRHRAAEALLSAFLGGAAPMPSCKSKPGAGKRLRSLTCHGLDERFDFRRVEAECAGNALARELTALPPNRLTPLMYRQRIRKLCREQGWKMRFLNHKALEKLNAGAFLAVAQGSPERDAGMVCVSYTPTRGKNRKPLTLVGKGICYDTGGVNLKPARHMHGMHEDMQGSAVALGALLALSRMKVPFPVHCWLALAQNHIGPRAYKQNDVVTACNGTTIEVMHTDAEGRMVLADTLALAARDKPALMIDYATLTGACIYALSTRYSGAFTNQAHYIQPLIEAGRASGERVWPFPLDGDFEEALESKIADIKQCTLDGEADHILAARFLQRFAGKAPWIHIDLSAGNHKGGLAHIPTDYTGFGVRLTLNLLLDQKIME